MPFLRQHATELTKDLEAGFLSLCARAAEPFSRRDARVTSAIGTHQASSCLPRDACIWCWWFKFKDRGEGQEGEGRKKERGGGKGRLGRESVKEGRVRKRLMGQIWSQTGVGEKVRGPGSGVAEWREGKEKEKELGLGEKRETRRGGRGGREKREEESWK